MNQSTTSDYKITTEEWLLMYNYISLFYGFGQVFTPSSKKVEMNKVTFHRPYIHKQEPNTESYISCADIFFTGTFPNSSVTYTCHFRKFFESSNVHKYSALGKYNISVVKISSQ